MIQASDSPAQYQARAAYPRIPSFICPSAPLDDTHWGIQMNIYGTVGKDWNVPSETLTQLPDQGTYIYTAAPQMLLGKSHYAAMAGYCQPDGPTYRGYFTHNSKNTIQGAKDGSSNTVMFIETAGGIGSLDGTTYNWIQMAWANAIVFAELGSCPDRTNPNCEYNHGGLGLGYGMPGSLHANNKMVTAFGDGSVRMLNPDLDFGTVWVPLCGMSDGDVVTFQGQ